MGTFSGLPGITEKIPLKISSRLLIQCLIVFHFDRFSCCDGELTGNFIAKSFRPQEIKNFLTLWSVLLFGVQKFTLNQYLGSVNYKMDKN